MLALRVVLDTNVVVSAALRPDGLQRTLLLLSITKPGTLYVSEDVLAEYREVLARPELAIRRSTQLALLDLIGKRARLVKPARRITAAKDPDDDIFLECADAARADYLVTGNTRDFPAQWKRTKIVTSREFFEIIGPGLAG